MSFNAKQALERIRQSKASASKADSQSVQQTSNNNLIIHDPSDFQSHRKEYYHGSIEQSNHFDELNASGFESIHSVQKENPTLMNELMRKVEQLERTTEKLSRELIHSQEIATMMRKEKSTLQNQILKLESENKNLKLDQKKKQTRVNDKVNYDTKQDSPDKVSKGGGSEESHSSDPINDSIQLIAKYGIVSQQFLEPVINQPLDKILEKKEKNFRALKINSRLLSNECKELHQLARIFKEYPTMEKPTIEIDISNLNEQDFDQ